MLRKLFCLKCFIPVTRAGVFIWENFHPVYRDLGRKNRDLGNQASHAGFSDEHMELFTKERVVGRDLGNRASPVNRAHMKRTLIMI